MIVTREHARFVPHGGGIGYCSKGIRAFFESHNLSYDDFVANGIDETKLTALNDVLSDRLVETAKRIAGNGK